MPEWINESFLKAILQGGEGQENNVSIIKFSVGPAVTPGNNFFSCIYRVQIQYTVSNSQSVRALSLIVKSPITEGYFATLSKKGNYFEKEMKVYNELLPRLNDKLKFEFAPKPFKGPNDSDLVLKDLLEDGYKVMDKYKRLDFSYCKSVMVNLAKFHAASVSLHHEDPTCVEDVGKEAAINENTINDEKPILEYCVKAVARIARETYGHEDLSEFLLSKLENLWESIVKIYSHKDGQLKVLNHGDMWINNILFKTGDLGEVADVKFIDFQLSRYGSPVLDLLYFFWTSADQEVRECKLQDLCKIYLQTLNSSLKDLGCVERLTLEELNHCFKSASDLFVLILCQLTPGMFSDPENTFALAEVNNPFDESSSLESNEFFESRLKGKYFWTLFPIIIRQFQNWVLNM
ncbi:uncharacterized protein LOC124367114 [Homalodisca vitripennis]|uniref:uncharacterized protein LOC124367114 n=1 Tax=Homalodisca vitripennis TaxID=197043 RepID=UPI001EEA6CB1|nr:uncharacterized protein LOC124367114 [Homalodisca vitripennis]